MSADVAITNAHYKTELASARLEQANEDSSPNIHNLAENWLRQHKGIIHSLKTLFNPDDATEVTNLSDLEECRKLTSFVNQLKEGKGDAQWLTTLSRREEMPQHAEQFATLEACCKELGNAVEVELGNSKSKLGKEEKSALRQKEQQESEVWARGGRMIPSAQWWPDLKKKNPQSMNNKK